MKNIKDCICMTENLLWTFSCFPFTLEIHDALNQLIVFIQQLQMKRHKVN